MVWLLAFVGALIGAIIGDKSESLLGFALGGLAAFFLFSQNQLRRQIDELEGKIAALRKQRPAPEPVPQADSSRPSAPERAPEPPPIRPSADVSIPTPPPTPIAEPPRAIPMPYPAPGTSGPAGRKESPRPASSNAIEDFFALLKSWLFEGNVPVKIGLLVLIFGAGALIKYATDAGWLSLPIELRLAGIAVAAIAGLIWGLREAKERPSFGLSMQGGSIGILLMVVFGAYRIWQVLPASMAFVLVLVLVAGSAVLAVRQNSYWLAALGFLGGYLAPVLLSTGSGNHIALFSYYAILNLAVLGIAIVRPWRTLNLLGFAFTFGIGIAWGLRSYHADLFWSVEPFLVGFYLMYVVIPVLYALRNEAPSGKVDGTLLFGTPILAFPLQVALFESERYPLAISAIIMAALYICLALWARKDVRLKLLAQTTATLALVFSTLAVPLALSARWTSAAWALQGAGLVWLGLKQDSRLTRYSGILLQFLAAGAYFYSIDYRWADDSVTPILNGHTLNLMLLSVGAFLVSWLYTIHRSSRHAVSVLLLSIGSLWWYVMGWREVGLHLQDDSFAFGLAGVAALTALGSMLLMRRIGWDAMRFVCVSALLQAPILLSIAQIIEDGWMFSSMMWLAAIYIAVYVAAIKMLAARESRLLATSHLVGLASLIITATLAIEYQLSKGLFAYEQMAVYLGEAWRATLPALPMLIAALLIWRRPHIIAWPVAAAFNSYRRFALVAISIFVGMYWLSLQFTAGNPEPMPFIPLINPVELVLVSVLLALTIALRERDDASRNQYAGIVALAAAATLTMMVIRACHQYLGYSWEPGILNKDAVQAALSIVWSLAGVAAWLIGSRRNQRGIWIIGAVLLAIVAIKLLLIDRRFLGDLPGILSFLVYGGLMVLVGRFAPIPPKREVAQSEETNSHE